MKFKHKPTEIEAFQWTGGPEQSDDPEWAATAINAGLISFEGEGSDHLRIVVQTREGVQWARPGTWVAKGVEGELYLIQPELFEKLYEPVVEPAIEEIVIGGLIDTWKGNWIVTVEAPNGMVAHHVVDPQLLEITRVSASDMLLGSPDLNDRVDELFARRNEVNPNG
jgi:hypothetical protein